MPTILQFRRGTAAQNANYAGSAGEITVDTTNGTLRVHDGATNGGSILVTETATQTLTNKTLTSPNLTTPTIGGTAIDEYIADTIGAMVSGNTESGIAVTYDDTDNTLDFDVGDFTITLAGDLSGSATVTNLGNATLTATIVANSVALGTDTTGNYVATGAVSGIGLSGSSSSEGGTFTVTSNATSANTASTIVARDASGNFTAGTITANLTGTASYATTAGAITSQANSATITAASTNTASQIVLRDASGNFSAGTITANLTGNVTGNASGSSGSCTGNAATATALQTARAINGVNFNGTAAITVEPYVEDDEATNATRLITFVDNSTAGYKRLNEDSTLNYNPSTGTLAATIFSGTATSARYADLAECYQADAHYAPGTVMVFGGDQEVTVATKSHDPAVAGIVSTDPAYLMNSALTGTNTVAIALTGRVPCMVKGPVAKGSVLVTGEDAGVAQAIDYNKFFPGVVLGKSMGVVAEGETKLIEVAVGRF